MIGAIVKMIDMIEDESLDEIIDIKAVLPLRFPWTPTLFGEEAGPLEFIQLQLVEGIYKQEQATEGQAPGGLPKAKHDPEKYKEKLQCQQGYFHNQTRYTVPLWDTIKERAIMADPTPPQGKFEECPPCGNLEITKLIHFRDDCEICAQKRGFYLVFASKEIFNLVKQSNIEMSKDAKTEYKICP